MLNLINDNSHRLLNLIVCPSWKSCSLILKNKLKVHSIRTVCTSYYLNRDKPISDFGLDKEARKHLKKRLSQVKSSLPKEHLYKQCIHVNSKNKLFSMIKNSEVHNEDGLIGLVKPYGIPRYKVEEPEKRISVSHTLNSTACGNLNHLSIEDILPLLRKFYNSNNLQVIYCPERWMSGIMLFGLDESVAKRAMKSFSNSLCSQEPHLTFWTVNHGIPVPDVVGEKVGIALKYMHAFGKTPVIKKTFSKREIIEGKVKPNVVEHVVRIYNKELDASLVEISVLNVSLHFLRVWSAHCYAPILGDLLYGGSVKTVLGKKVKININASSSYQPPEVTKTLREALCLNPSQVELIPAHIHLAKLKLKSFKRKQNVIITAQPPEHFMWTCKQLSLMVEDSEPLTDFELEEENYLLEEEELTSR